MSVIEVPVRSAPTLPPEAPLDMPVQSLRTGRLRGRRFPTTPGGMFWRRAAVIGAAIVLTLVATYQIWWLLRGAGTDVLEAVLLVLFVRSEEHTSELQSLMRISYAVFCLEKKNTNK